MAEHSEPGIAGPRLGLAVRRRELVALIGMLAALGVVLALLIHATSATRAPDARILAAS